MQRVTTVAELRAVVRAWRAQGLRTAFVPTMGNLHAGHLSLITRARELADRVVASIFVNPTQFGPNEDYERYPRTLEADASGLAQVGCDLLFQPGVAEVYPDGPQLDTRVSVEGLNGVLCGAVRPGHFDGVATVVAKLLNFVGPDALVLGEKDYQQLLVLRRMVRDLAFPVEVVGAPTAREAHGLAMSSRNQYLSAADRHHAGLLFHLLRGVRDAIRIGQTDYAALSAAALGELHAQGFVPDYFEIRRAADLAPPESSDLDLVILVAARLGGARLIDNLRVVRPTLPSV